MGLRRLKVATRVLNEAYFMGAFLEYYDHAGVDEIHIFDSGSEDGTTDIVEAWARQTGRTSLISVGAEMRHTSQSRETLLCNLIFRHAIEDYEREREPCWWLFPDVDEFVRAPNGTLGAFLSNSGREAVRSVFVDWYLPPDMARTNLTATEVLRLARSGSLRGRLGDLWRDPFCKDYAILLDPRTYRTFRRVSAVSGFHRLVLDGRLLLPPNDRYLIVDHLRGIPLGQALKRVGQRLLLL